MVKDRDEESGQYTETVTDEEIAEFVRNSNGLTTSEVADEFDYERPTAYRRLKSLEESGDVQSRKIGNSLLWESSE
ncbi:winged helix-turn-helix domain-containing protein [Natronococcus occultus]|nr:winged helix-turn-helix domain-containing protein [Natronococcus occultus]